MRLPVALAEWYELVGRRLRFVQDHPCPLDAVEVVNGSIAIWWENQGVWEVRSPADGDDPIAFARKDASSSPDAPLGETLLGLLVSETLVGAWAGSHEGALGALRAAVRGGNSLDTSDKAIEKLRRSYSPLGYVRNPTFDVPMRGTEDVIIRAYDVAVEWMTATDDAFAALDRVLAL